MIIITKLSAEIYLKIDLLTKTFFSLLYSFAGRRQRDTRSNFRSNARNSGAGVDRCAPISRKIEGVLWTLAGTGKDCAETAGTTRGRSTQSHTTFRDAAGSGEAISRDFGVRSEIWWVQSESAVMIKDDEWNLCDFFMNRWKHPRFRMISATTDAQSVAKDSITITSRS